MNIEEKKIELLAKQCEIIDQKILAYQSLGSKVLGFGSALILSILAFALKEKLTYVLIVLPIGMFTLIFYWMNVNAWVLSEGGYKKALEEKLNKMLGEDIYLWETKIVQSKHTNINNIVIDIICAFVLISSIAASIYASKKIEFNYAPEFVILINLILSILAIFCLARNKTEFNRTYDEAKKYFRDDPRKLENS